MINEYICCHCGFPVQFDTETSKRCACGFCGTINKRPDKAAEGWLPCIEPTSFEWSMTSGVMGPDVPTKAGKVDYDALVALPINANVIYMDAMGKQWSRADWIRRKGFDPATQLRGMRLKRKPMKIVTI
jgi:hypothetical protein